MSPRFVAVARMLLVVLAFFVCYYAADLYQIRLWWLDRAVVADTVDADVLQRENVWTESEWRLARWTAAFNFYRTVELTLAVTTLFVTLLRPVRGPGGLRVIIGGQEEADPSDGDQE